ncbi:MAG: 4Fe-4S binding protein [Rhodothermales bacterium]|nr:4Fe-4S binding protein [Rhodothermales bacterium]
MPSIPVYNAHLALGDNPAHGVTAVQKAGLAAVALSLLGMTVALFSDLGAAYPIPMLTVIGGLLVGGVLTYVLDEYRRRSPGVRNEGVMFNPNMARGALGWVVGIVLTGLYVLLYWYPETLEGLIRVADPLSYTVRGSAADQWFLYGTFYTVAVLVMGVRALLKYRHSRYHVIRTFSVMFFQLGFAFLIPYLLVRFNEPELYFHYFWPLDYDLLFPSQIGYLFESGGIGVFMVFWGAVLTFVAVPVLTYFFGKRWYCSWVCGCGGLAETAGDPYRHLSQKELSAWKVERWLIHGVLVAIVVTTGLLWVDQAQGGAVLGGWSGTFAQGYGFYIGAIFSGVIGVGFYPLMGSRVWCRYGCPLAAMLGLVQRYFSRFRITTNGGQCISCGNCSAYCEMGIDVRWYAQRGQNVIRSSCVGCGICATVCPRGVLALENGPRAGRFGEPTLVLIDDLDILEAPGEAGPPERPPETVTHSR